MTKMNWSARYSGGSISSRSTSSLWLRRLRKQIEKDVQAAKSARIRKRKRTA